MIVDGNRALAYVTTVDDIIPLEGYDRVEYAAIKGWRCVVGKGMKKGDKAIYFEVDSLLPNTDTRFAFLEKRKYRIKTQKMCGVLSQGLLMPLSDFPELGDIPVDTDVTEKLGVKYYVPEDNVRKAKIDPNAKYKAMASRRAKLFKHQPFRWLMRRGWGRKLLYALFGNKKAPSSGFPTKFPFVKKTDEERVENMPWILENKDPWIETCKIDGTSSTYILERVRHKFRKDTFEYYVCSRNVRLFSPDDKTYHESNVYWDMEKKYGIREILQEILNGNPNWDYVCLQGETAGVGCQGNPHNLPDTRFYGFNFIDSEHGRWNTIDAAEFMAKFEIPWVPITNTNYILPDTMEEFKAHADGRCDAPESSGLREGFVYRSLDGQTSFKNVSNKYLMSK